MRWLVLVLLVACETHEIELVPGDAGTADAVPGACSVVDPTGCSGRCSGSAAAATCEPTCGPGPICSETIGLCSQRAPTGCPGDLPFCCEDGAVFFCTQTDLSAGTLVCGDGS
jgi:hypothetical protein